MLRSVTQLVLEGVADGPAALAIDIIGAAARLSPHRVRTVRLVPLDGAPVRTASGRLLQVDGAVSKVRFGAADVLVMPGIGTLTSASAIESALRRPDVLRASDVLAHASKRGAIVAASCSATFVLAASGVLDGREATTTWFLASTFIKRFPRVTLRADRMVVRAGRVFTGGTAFGHADLLLALLAETTTPSLASEVARYLVLEERPAQSRYMLRERLQTDDPIIAALERFASSNLRKQLTLAQMARATGTSPRTLARRVEQALGTTPLRFVQRLRMAHAASLLETTTRSIDDIAERVGYADAAAFRRTFRREAGESPREWRAR